LSESATIARDTVPASAGAVSRRFDSGNDHLRRAIPIPSDHTLLQLSGWAMVTFAALFVGFVFHLLVFSNLAEHRSQSMLYTQFRNELALGTAPIGQVDARGALLPMGAPVALVSIPALGITDTVVEGTSGSTLLDGPGHRRDTPLPGQQGVSVLYGRQAGYGGPFSGLETLKIGQTIVTTTGQGRATYRVVDVRYAGTHAPALASATAGRLTLVSSAGVPFASGSVVRVDADLVGKAFPTPQPVLRIGSVSAAEEPMASDPSGWMPLLLWGELAIAVTVAIILALRRWGTWQTWIVGLCVALLVGTQLAEQIVIVLPNLY
jgi:hypothetical protein